MRKHIALGVALILGTAGSAYAADGVNYNLLEGSYGYTDYKGYSGHEDSYTLGGSYGFAESFFGYASVSAWDAGSGDKGKHGGVGVGWHTGVSDAVDLLAGVSFIFVDPNGYSSETGYAAQIGLRGRMGMNVELNGGVDYYDLGHGADGFEFSVGGLYYFTEMFGAGLSVGMDDSGDYKTFGLTLRYDFGG